MCIFNFSRCRVSEKNGESGSVFVYFLRFIQIILKKGFSEIFTGDRLTQTNPSLKLSLLQGLEFKDFCVKNAIVVIHLRFFVGSSFVIINNKKKIR